MAAVLRGATRAASVLPRVAHLRAASAVQAEVRRHAQGWVDNVVDLIGMTPMVRLNKCLPDDVVAKNVRPCTRSLPAPVRMPARRWKRTVRCGVGALLACSAFSAVWRHACLPTCRSWSNSRCKTQVRRASHANTELSCLAANGVPHWPLAPALGR